VFAEQIRLAMECANEWVEDGKEIREEELVRLPMDTNKGSART
jgi:hypothetical protein